MDADGYGCADIIDVAIVRRCVGMDSREMVDSLSNYGSRVGFLLYYLSLRLSSTLGSSLAQATPCIVLLSSFVS